jgi:spore germination cell wall hydrolase CwlJ-like protein
VKLLFMLAWLASKTDPMSCLADNVYYEAAHEPYAGKVAVAEVTLNRARERGGDICGAVYAKALNAHTGKKEAAFSWTLGARWRPHGLDTSSYAECVDVASAALAGTLPAVVGPDVIYYHAAYIHPRWALHLRRVARIGKHIFYRRPR